MAKFTKVIFKIFTAFLFALVSGCANQLPPGGGEVDKIPPQVIEVSPANGTVNFNKNYFELTFSEYVEKSSVRDAIFISPSLQYPLEYDWSGKTLAVTIKDTLKNNTTYTITIGSDVRDLNNNNKMAESFTFAFSTGNKIEKGKINGKVYGPEHEGIMLFAYKNSGQHIDPSKIKPDYISQSGKDGKFTLLGMADGEYNVYAVSDRIRESKYHPGEDEFGVQSRPVNLNEKFNEISDLDFFLTKEDTAAPRISNVIMKDRNHLLIEFNKGIDSLKMNSSNFYLYDSVSNKKIFPPFVYKGDAKARQYYIGLTDTMEKKDAWMLVSKGIPDKYFNLSPEERNQITVRTDRDTTALKPTGLKGLLTSGKVDFEDPVVNLNFNDAIDSTILKNKISVTDSKGNLYPFSIKKNDDANFNVAISTKLKQSVEYNVKVDLKKFKDYCGNEVDSLFQFKFTSSNELEFSGASGDISGVSDSADVYVVLQNAADLKVNYTQKTNAAKKFDVKKITPGKYLAWSYKDKNKNGRYDCGTIIPFKYSEEFKFYPDTLNLRARWPVGGININFEK